MKMMNMMITLDKKENGVFTLDTDTMLLEKDGKKYETYLDYSMLRFEFSKPLDKNGKKIDGLKLSDEQINIIKKAVEEKANTSVKNWVWGFGIDTNLFRITAQNKQGRFVDSEQTEKIEKLLVNNEKKIMDELKANSTTKEDRFIISNRNVMRIFNRLNAEKIETQSKINEERQKKIEEAKATGKEIVLSSYAVECDGSVESCDVDTISEVVQADGTIVKRRSHSY